jgi:hypothetical protein
MQVEFLKTNVEGSPKIDLVTGITTQAVTIVSQFVGNPHPDKFLQTDYQVFDLDNSLSIEQALAQLDVQASQWVDDTYNTPQP